LLQADELSHGAWKSKLGGGYRPPEMLGKSLVERLKGQKMSGKIPWPEVGRPRSQRCACSRIVCTDIVTDLGTDSHRLLELVNGPLHYATRSRGTQVQALLR
jgi:hypothetical protein